MRESDSLEVWDRACSPSPHLGFPGDRALARMITLHSLIMNGGVHHALDALDSREVEEGIRGYELFGLTTLGQVIARVRDDSELRAWNDTNEQTASRMYWDIAPDDEPLVRAFHEFFLANPGAFAPIS